MFEVGCAEVDERGSKTLPPHCVRKAGGVYCGEGDFNVYKQRTYVLSPGSFFFSTGGEVGQCVLGRSFQSASIVALWNTIAGLCIVVYMAYQGGLNYLA